MANHKIDHKQREALAKLVTEAERNERNRLEEEHGADSSSIIQGIAEEMGAGDFIKKDAQLKEQIEKLQQERNLNSDQLEELGFDFDDGEFKLRWNARDALRKAVQRKKKELSETFLKSLNRYTSATAKIWSVSSEEELQSAVEGLL